MRQATRSAPSIASRTTGITTIASRNLRIVKGGIKARSNVHRPGDRPNVFLFSLPRSGSTWLMELIWSQPGFKFCDEPTDLRNPLVRRHLGIDDWQLLYSDAATERLDAYFDAFCSGRATFMNPSPLGAHYRPRTDRIVFKVIHGCEDRINHVRDTFNGRIVYLTRHPLAVSLSRKELPTLQPMIDGAYARHFTPDQLAYARKITEHGSHLEQAVLCWCLQTAVPMRMAMPDWAVVSYEQLVIDPNPVIEQIAARLELPAPDTMLTQLSVPSNSTFKSDGATQQALDRGASEQRSWLIEKWRGRISHDEENRLMDMLQRFDLHSYRAGEVLPTDHVWIRSAIVPGASRSNGPTTADKCIAGSHQWQAGQSLPQDATPP